jgi:hypothetical protein
MSRIGIIKHEAVPRCGSYEVRFPDGRPSRYFYWDDEPNRRLRPELRAALEQDRRPSPMQVKHRLEEAADRGGLNTRRSRTRSRLL